MDPGSIGAIVTALKTALDLVKGWRDDGEGVTVTMDSVHGLTTAVLEAQDHALNAREAQFELARRNDALESELRALRKLNAEREKYEIANVGSRGAYVYAPKSGSMPDVTPHWLCQPCFDASKKTLLQYVNTLPDSELGAPMALWRCPVCKTHVRARQDVNP